MLADSSDLPGTSAARPKPDSRGRGGSPLVPYLVLLRVGFTLPPRLPEERCALTAPFHPYPGGCRGGVFSVALSVNYPLRVAPRPLAGTLPCGDRTFLPAIMARRLPVRRTQVDSSTTPFGRIRPAHDRVRVWREGLIGRLWAAPGMNPATATGIPHAVLNCRRCVSESGVLFSPFKIACQACGRLSIP